jgi:predicted DNA-binding transcriptional regulator AlpA
MSTITTTRKRYGRGKIACELATVSLRTWRHWDALEKIPAPIRLGTRTVVWDLDEIEAWMAAGAPSRDEWEVIKAAQASKR